LNILLFVKELQKQDSSMEEIYEHLFLQKQASQNDHSKLVELDYLISKQNFTEVDKLIVFIVSVLSGGILR